MTKKRFNCDKIIEPELVDTGFYHDKKGETVGDWVKNMTTRQRLERCHSFIEMVKLWWSHKCRKFVSRPENKDHLADSTYGKRIKIYTERKRNRKAQRYIGCLGFMKETP